MNHQGQQPSNLHTHRTFVRARGLTLVELIVTGTTILLAFALLSTTLGAGTRDRSRFQSSANLMALNEAHHTYAMDWMGRQWSLLPDDFDQAGGNVADYNSDFRCLDSVILGNDADGVLWAWWIGGGQCDSGIPGNIGYWQGIVNSIMSPYSISGFETGAKNAFHSRSFRTYVSDNVYDPAFYQPGTRDALLASRALDEDVEFTSPGSMPKAAGNFFAPFPGYELSASAMWGMDIHRAPSEGGWQDPRETVGGYATPTVDQCLNPSLKTRMMELWWVDGAPSRFHPATRPDRDLAAGRIGTGLGGNHWFSNGGHESRPQTLFFDGSIAPIRVGDAYDDDLAHQEATGGDGLWSRDTPFGAEGLYGNRAQDPVASFHHLTTDGIRGRDILSRDDG